MATKTRHAREGYAAGYCPVVAALAAAAITLGMGGSAAAAGGTATFAVGGSNNWNSSSRWTWSGNASCTWNGTSGTKCIPGVDSNASGAAVSIGASVTVDTSVGTSSTIASISITSGTTTVSGANTVTTSSDFTVNGGNFTAGSGTISVGGSLAIQSGTFTASTGTTQVTGRFNKTGGTFAANGGTVVLNAAGAVSHTFGGATFSTATIGTDLGLVGYWKLDETSGTALADSSAYHNDGTLSGGTGTTSPASGFSFTNSSAITLNGSTGYATLGTTGVPDNNASQSISLWVKLTSTAAQQNAIVLTDGSASAVQVGIKDGSLKVWGWGGGDYVSTTAPSLSTWHHIGYTWDGTTNKLYVDGGTPATSTTAHQTGSVANVYLGTWSPTSDLYNGALDDVRIYRRAISASEVSTLASKNDLSSSAGGTHTFTDAFATSGTFTIGSGTVTGSGTLSIGGSFLNTGGTFSGSGLVTLAGTSTGLSFVPNGATVSALTVNGSGGSYAFGGTVAITGNFTVTAGTVTGSGAMSVGGNWANSGTFLGTGAVTLTGSGAKTILSNGGRFSSLTINGGGTYTMSDRFSASGATVTLTNSTLAGGTQTARIGQFSLTGTGAFSPGTGTVILDGTASQTLGPSSFSGLRVESMGETGLVGYWKLDEGAGTGLYDSSGNGNSGTLSSTGMTWQSTVPTTIYDNQKSLSFNGSTGYASLGVTNLPATDAAHTIAFWANLSSTAGTQNMVALLGTNGNAVQVGIRAIAAVQSLVAWGNGGGTLVSTSAPSTGTWHHIAYVYDGASGQKLYVDGTAASASTANQTGSITTAYLGTYAPNNEMYSGSLDDVRIYNTALTATQIAALVAGRYAGTGGAATVSLGANTAVSGPLEIDAGTLAGNAKTMSASYATSAALLRGGAYDVGSAAQTFSGGLTVQAGGTLTLGTSGGSVKIASGKALTVDGTLSASSTGATIQSASGTYDFWVGSTNGATPTLNITGLMVKNTTANGMRINGNGSGTTTATTTFTNFNNIAFSSGTAGGSLLQIYAPSLNLVSYGCSFDASTTYTVKLVGDGFTSGVESTQTRAIFGGATCSAGACQGTESDDDSNNDGVPSTTAAPGGSVVQFVSNAPTDTVGTIEGFPTAAFSWNDGSWYSTYVAFHDTSGTVDTVYVRDTTGAAKYSWSTSSTETIVGTPRWTTEGSGASEKHYVYVALASGKVYRLLDNGASLAPDTTTTGWSSANPYNCSCTISTAIAMDMTNLYWAGQKSSDSSYRIWAVGQSNQSVPGWSPMRPSTVSSPTTSETAVTSASLATWTSGSTYVFLGQTGYLVKANVSTGTVAEYNSNPGTGKSILGRIIVVGTGTNRVLAGDDGGNFWSIAPGTFTGTNKQWNYSALAGTDQVKSTPIYDYTAGFVHFGTEGGRLVVLNAASGAALTGYPMTTLTTDSMRTAVLYRNGVVAVGTTTGKLFFVNRRTVSAGTPQLMREYYFGSSEQVSGISYDSNSNKYLVTTSSSASKDGRLYTIDASDAALTDSDGNL